MFVEQARELQSPRWLSMDCRLDATASMSPVLGLLALAGDSTIEDEMRRYLPATLAKIVVTRVRMEALRSPESFTEVREQISDAVRRLLPGEVLAAIAFGCTSGAAVIGPDDLKSIIQEVRPGVAVTDPVSACVAKLRKLNASRIALITPYVQSINDRMVAYLEQCGLVVELGFRLSGRGSRLIGFTPPTRVSPHDIRAAILECHRHASVDAILVSCTGLRCFQALSELNQSELPPIVTSTSALASHARQLMARPVL